jgi:acyl carrier protein
MNIEKEVRSMAIKDVYEEMQNLLIQFGLPSGAISSRAFFFGDFPEIDSLSWMELLFRLEETFGIEIPDEDADRIKTVGDAVRAVRAKLALTAGV